MAARESDFHDRGAYRLARAEGQAREQQARRGVHPGGRGDVRGWDLAYLFVYLSLKHLCIVDLKIWLTHDVAQGLIGIWVLQVGRWSGPGMGLLCRSC